MKEHYEVKFQSAASQPGEPPIWKYGIAVDPRWASDAAKGLIIVSDAVLPTQCLVAEKDIVDLPGAGVLPWDDYVKREYVQYIQAEYDKAEAVDQAIPDGVVAPGRLFQLGVADGLVYYVVTAVSPKGKSCTIEWRGYHNPDRYVDQRYGWQHKVKVSEIEPFIRCLRSRTRNPLFGSKVV